MRRAETPVARLDRVIVWFVAVGQRAEGIPRLSARGQHPCDRSWGKLLLQLAEEVLPGELRAFHDLVVHLRICSYYGDERVKSGDCGSEQTHHGEVGALVFGPEAFGAAQMGHPLEDVVLYLPAEVRGLTDLTTREAPGSLRTLRWFSPHSRNTTAGYQTLTLKQSAQSKRRCSRIAVGHR